MHGRGQVAAGIIRVLPFINDIATTMVTLVTPSMIIDVLCLGYVVATQT